MKSQRLKKDREKLLVLEKENEILKKEKSSLEQNVQLLKVVIQKNRDGTENQKKSLEKTHKELMRSMEQCKAVAVEGDLLRKELLELRAAAQTIVEMVDPVEEGVTDKRALVEHLYEAPQKISSYLTDTSKQYIVHILGLVKSYWPQARLAPLGDGMAVECTEDWFTAYVEEAKPVAEKIDKMLEPEAGA